MERPEFTEELELAIEQEHPFTLVFEADEVPSATDLIDLQPALHLYPREMQPHYKRFAKQLDRFSHGLTELKESALSYRAITHGLIAAYVVLHAVAEQEGVNTPQYILMEIKPQVKEKGKRVAYAMRRLGKHKQDGTLVGGETPDTEVELGDAFDLTGNVLDFTVGATPQIRNATMPHRVARIYGIYSTYPQDIANVA